MTTATATPGLIKQAVSTAATATAIIEPAIKPDTPRKPRSVGVGVWDAGEILDVEPHYGPFLPDDIVIGPQGKVWRLITNHNGQRLTGYDVTELYLNGTYADLAEQRQVDAAHEDIYGQV